MEMYICNMTNNTYYMYVSFVTLSISKILYFSEMNGGAINAPHSLVLWSGKGGRGKCRGA